jgi:hypothetical protein
MSGVKAELSGPDLTQGVALSTIPDGAMLLGHARGEPVLLARRGNELFGGDVSSISAAGSFTFAATNTNITTLANLTTHGAVTSGSIASGFGTIVTTNTISTAAHTITSASANALAVGRQGATQPAFNVDASTALQTAGLNVKAAALNGTVAVAVIDTSGNTNLTINALGAGTIGIGSISTGAVTITPATTVTGTLTASNAFSAGSITGPLATNAVKGVMEGDGTTITCSAGICTASGAAATSIDANGATSISNGTSNAILYDLAGNVGKIAVVNSAVLVTSSGGVPSESTTLPAFTMGGNIAAGNNKITGIGNAFFNQASSVHSGVIESSYTGNTNVGIVLNDSSGTFGSAFMQFYAGATGLGSITNNNNTGVLYNNTSDARLKIDYGDAKSGLDDLMKVKVHDAAFKSAPNAHKDMFFAQELVQIYPQCVSKGDDDPTTVAVAWAVDYGCVTPLLVRAIQQMKAEIDALKNK